MSTNVEISGYLSNPLSSILTSRSLVDVLRYFFRKNRPLSAGEVITALNLSRQGVYNSLNTLVETGVLEMSGSVSVQHYQIRTESVMYSLLRNLFEQEQQHFENFKNELKKQFDFPEVLSLWIYGKHAKGTDTFADGIQVACLIDSADFNSTSTQLMHHFRMSGFEKRFDPQRGQARFRA